MIEYSEDHRVHVSGEISYRDVEAYLDGTVYLSIAAPRQVLRNRPVSAALRGGRHFPNGVTLSLALGHGDGSG